MIKKLIFLVRALTPALLALVVILSSAQAFAAGRVQWKEKQLKERDNDSWRLEVAIYMPRAPDVAHVPMKFEFQPTAYYERSMVDGDKLIERTVPLEHHQSMIESVDVGFLDSGSGKIESRTRFTFKVTRAHGYEAGEYRVTIIDTRNGQKIGTPTTLKFLGENEVIDRRSITFTGEKKKKKPEEKADEGKASDEGKGAEDEASGGSEPEADTGSDEGGEPEDDMGEGDDGPPSIEEKPGGCGCTLPGSSGSPPGAWALALGVFALFFLRRRFDALG